MENDIYQDGRYLENNPTWHAEDSSWKAQQIARILGVNNISPATVCEVGCGAGEILKCLSEELGSDVMFSGYEISAQAYEICRTKETQNVHFYLEDILDQAESTFDLVMAIDVFEHIEDYLGFLRKLRSKGTYKIFHIPLDLSIQTVLRSSPILNERVKSGHLHYFTKETALATLEDTGYEVVDHCYTSASSELPNRSWKANLLKIPRRAAFSIHRDWAARIFGGFSLLVLTK
jgi:cyclopropane fatty-acyl-phospholipid synthase-like methyltransferase